MGVKWTANYGPLRYGPYVLIVILYDIRVSSRRPVRGAVRGFGSLANQFNRTHSLPLKITDTQFEATSASTVLLNLVPLRNREL